MFIYRVVKNGLLMNDPQIISAAMVVIGDEILSGRTRDSNAAHCARILNKIGIHLSEIRFVGDDEGAIVEAVNSLRMRNTYVFTSGGIGPTHDDITAQSIAVAFGLPCDYDERALEILSAHYESRDLEFTSARKRMARVPEGAGLIDNPISAAPGFVVGNVYTMAGVPAIFEAMLDQVIPSLRTGSKMLSQSLHCDFGEGVIGERLAHIQKKHPETVIGSYPKYENGHFWTELIVRSIDKIKLDSAVLDINALLAELNAEHNKAR